jgi:hypothetical protein
VAWFHRTFCDTQTRAFSLAVTFNERLARVPGVSASTPRVSFLECSVYVMDDGSNSDVTGVLVEKQLDVSSYRKWNDNKGGVDGVAAPPMPALDAPLGAIVESGDDEEEDEDEDGGELDAHAQRIFFSDAEIPQAFSHFTFRNTKRRLLVCDLQGVLAGPTAEGAGPRFEFTDPVIHFKSRSGRSNVFGRTDLGRRGIDAFFQTHECGELCRMLNRRWVRRPGQCSGRG